MSIGPTAERYPTVRQGYDPTLVESDLAANRAALSREYFIGLFSATDLARLCDALPAVAEL